MNHFDKQLSELINLLYESALEPARWPNFLARLTDNMNAKAAALIIHDSNSRQHNADVSVHLDPEAAKLYQQYFGERDVWMQRGRQIYRTGWVGSGDELCPPAVLVESEFYNDFLKRFDTPHLCAAGIDVGTTYTANVSVLRSDHQGDFEDWHIALLRLLLPHLQTAVKLHDKLILLHEEKRNAERTIESLGIGMIFLDFRGHIVLANSAAQKILDASDGLSYRKGTVQAALCSESKELHHLILGACQTAAGRGFHPGGTILVSRQRSPRPLQLLISPFRPTRTLINVRPAAVLFIIDPDSRPVPDELLLQKLFALTPAEARLSIRLAMGDSVSEAAAISKISINTVKTHLKSVFAKTNTGRQSQLIALLAGLLPHQTA